MIVCAGEIDEEEQGFRTKGEKGQMERRQEANDIEEGKMGYSIQFYKKRIRISRCNKIKKTSTYNHNVSLV